MKIFYLICCLLFLAQSVLAQTIHVKALEDFSTEKPPEQLSVIILDDIELDSDLSFKSGDIVYGKIVDVIEPKRMKRNAGFSFVPISYKPYNEVLQEISGYYLAKYTTKLNKGEIAKSAALSVGNHFVKGISLGYKAVEGAVKNEKDNRFKSSINEVYEATPFSYVEVGNQINIEKEEVFLLNFKTKNNKDLPNYEYESLDEWLYKSYIIDVIKKLCYYPSVLIGDS